MVEKRNFIQDSTDHVQKSGINTKLHTCVHCTCTDVTIRDNWQVINSVVEKNWGDIRYEVKITIRNKFDRNRTSDHPTDHLLCRNSNKTHAASSRCNSIAGDESEITNFSENEIVTHVHMHYSLSVWFSQICAANSFVLFFLSIESYISTIWWMVACHRITRRAGENVTKIGAFTTNWWNFQFCFHRWRCCCCCRCYSNWIVVLSRSTDNRQNDIVIRLKIYSFFYLVWSFGRCAVCRKNQLREITKHVIVRILDFLKSLDSFPLSHQYWQIIFQYITRFWWTAAFAVRKLSIPTVIIIIM